MKTTNNHPFTDQAVREMLTYAKGDYNLAITYLYEELEMREHLG